MNKTLFIYIIKTLKSLKNLKKEKNKYYIYIVNNALTKDIKINEIIRNHIKLVEENKIILEIAEYDLKIWKNS